MLHFSVFFAVLINVAVIHSLSFSIKRMHTRCFKQNEAPQDVYEKECHAGPQLFLIAGCTGAGKSTLGVTLAQTLGLSRIVSTDSVRSVLRAVISAETSPALHRSSYSGTGDVIAQWKECCEVIQPALTSLLTDSFSRGTSLIIEGVHVLPRNELLEHWRGLGGRGAGCLLSIPDVATHQTLLAHRMASTRSVTAARQLQSFHRIRTIHDEMARMASQAQWLVLQQQLQTSPDELARLLVQQQEQ